MFIGRQETVYGEIASAHFVAKSMGAPTFLHLCKPYPARVFSLAVQGSDRPEFEKLPETLLLRESELRKGA